MIALQIADIKHFMQKLLLTDSFDRFYLLEGTVTTFNGSLTVYLLLLHKCNSILSLILAGFPAFFFVKFLKYFCSYF